jgi:hypothetical protein
VHPYRLNPRREPTPSTDWRRQRLGLRLKADQHRGRDLSAIRERGCGSTRCGSPWRQYPTCPLGVRWDGCRGHHPLADRFWNLIARPLPQVPGEPSGANVDAALAPPSPACTPPRTAPARGGADKNGSPSRVETVWMHNPSLPESHLAQTVSRVSSCNISVLYLNARYAVAHSYCLNPQP